VWAILGIISVLTFPAYHEIAQAGDENWVA